MNDELSANELSLEELERAEDRLQDAVRKRDPEALEPLLHDQVRLMGPDGSVIGKEEDLASYRSGAFLIRSLTEIGREVQRFGDTGITRVSLDLVAESDGRKVEARLAYTRTWHLTEGAWRVVAVQGSTIPV